METAFFPTTDQQDAVAVRSPNSSLTLRASMNSDVAVSDNVDRYVPGSDAQPQPVAKRAAVTREEVNAKRWLQGVDWPTAIWIGLVHVGALAAPFFFTWQGLVSVMILGWVTGSLGICMGYHRLFTHSSFCTYKPVRWALAFIGGLAGEGSALHWTANHRKHHSLSDKPGDPHSPLDGPWWSHMFWFMPHFTSEENKVLHRRWVPDLLKDPVMVFLHKTFIVWHIVLGLALYALGAAIWNSHVGWSLVVYGMFVRLVYVLHATWFVNSATHIWGYRNYATSDESRNLWWVAIIAYGEGWHNNHHAYPRMAVHGHKWWEVDMTFMAIRVLRRLGLAWNVVTEIPNTKPK